MISFFSLKSRRLTFFYRLTFINLLFFIFHRIAFFWIYNPSRGEIADETFLRAFSLGFRFDLRVVVILPTLILLLSFIPYLDPLRFKWVQRFYAVLLTLFFFATQFIFAADYIHYAYLGSRVNAAVLEYLGDFSISMQMVWQTYPVIKIFFGLFFLTSLFLWVLNKALFSLAERKEQKLSRGWGQLIVRWGVTCSFILISLWGQISQYPLRWSDAHFDLNPFISQFTLNPIITFAESVKFAKQEYDMNEVIKNYHEVANYLKIPPEMRNLETLNYKRVVTPIQKREGTPPNVVIIVAESLAWFMTGLSKNPMNGTPFLDQLAKESLLFNNFYVPVQATARSVFALLTGIPDVTHLETSTRNPLIVDQHSILNEIKGYKKFYFLGGSASWGNIRGILSNNIQGLEIFEESDFNYNRNDVWGISDYRLADEANRVLKEQKEPFVAIFQTSGLHRPYTIPTKISEKGDFKEANLSENELTQYGFDHLKQFNSLLFQDYSIQHLIELAKNESYYSNTLFIIFGDHGLPVNGAKHIAKYQRDFDLENFHVPLVFHGPKFFTSGLDERYVSEVDIMPTVASFLGQTYVNTTLGRDIFDPQFDDQRLIFTFYWYHRPPRYATFGKEFCYLGGYGEQPKSLFRFHREDMNSSAEALPPDFPGAVKYESLAHALFHTSHYMMRHNGKKKAEE